MSESRIEYYGPTKCIEKPTFIVAYNVIKRLKKNRAPSEGGITAELVRYGGGNLWRGICNLMTVNWENEGTPADWQTAVICSIYKKGDRLQCENYRGISLRNVVYKIFTNVVTQYLEIYAEEILGDYQCGFRQGQSTTDKTFTLRQIIEKTYEF
jgi:sorting nexin-29